MSFLLINKKFHGKQMDPIEFSLCRIELNKTQKQLSQLLGTSLKAVASYEQGWRNIPSYIERQLLFLLFMEKQGLKTQKPCWTVKQCPTEQKEQCPAWEFNSGKLCWMINGTYCLGSPQNNWEEKMEYCRSCDMLNFLY